MAPHPLPDDPTLEQLAGRADDLLRGVRAGDGWALDLVAEHDPQGAPSAGSSTGPSTGWTPAEARRALARIHGFDDWAALADHLALVARLRRTPDEVGVQDDPADEFLRLACLTYGADDPARTAAAAALLDADPSLGSDNVWVAAARCDGPELRRLLTDDPGLADREGGPHRWAPLVYLAYARLDPSLTEAAVVDAARTLLDAGADPDTGYLWHGLPSPFTVLTGAFGGGEGGPRLQPPHPQGPALARVLLEAGADVHDGQALYNRMFQRADDHLELLVEHGLGRGDGGAWKQRLGSEVMGPAQLLLAQLSWAVGHGFARRVVLLADLGVDLTAPLHDFGGTGGSAYATALASGQLGIARLLESRGAGAGAGLGDLLDDADHLAAAVLSGDRVAVVGLGADSLRRALDRRPGLVVWAACGGDLEAVRLAVALGWDVSARAGVDPQCHPSSDLAGESALHQAAQQGDVAMARLLLDLGADLTVRDSGFDATPLMWAGYFGQPDVVALLGS